MQAADALRALFPAGKRLSPAFRVLSLGLGGLLLLAVSLLYVWSHIHMTQLEYRIARELGVQERLLDEQGKLKVELATLKAPARIEAIARDKLQMKYPEREQVIVLP